jgi:hypothetical protein
MRYQGKQGRRSHNFPRSPPVSGHDKNNKEADGNGFHPESHILGAMEYKPEAQASESPGGRACGVWLGGVFSRTHSLALRACIGCRLTTFEKGEGQLDAR